MTYSISCTGSGGTATGSVMVSVDVLSYSLPSWVPAPGRIAVLTQSGGTLTNSFISTVASYYEPYYSAKIVNDYSSSIFNPYFGKYGAILFFGGGHFATNDNSVIALEL